MRALFLLVLLTGAGLFAHQKYFVPPPGFTVSREADAARPFLVKIHADYCQKCVNLGRTWMSLDARLGESARLVVLDVTNEERFEDTQRIARYLGISGFLKQHMEQTGTIAVIHGETREPMATFDGERSLRPYLAALERARQG